MELNDVDKVPLGTEKKLVVSIDPIEGLHMSGYNFTVEAYTRGKILSIPKSKTKKIDDDNYAVCVDTAQIGKGRMMIKVIAQIPDADFDDLLRTEISIVDTRIDVI